MPRFAANLSMMYGDRPFLERFEAAARDGFRAVEFLSPYDWEPAELRARLDAHGLEQVLFNTPPDGTDRDSIRQAWAAGAKGLTGLPGRERDFRAGVELALRYAEALRCPRLHLMAGALPAGVSRDQALSTYRDNLAWAARRADAAGVDVLIEPINTRDMPGYLLNRQDEAHALVQQIGEPRLRVQMDLYHCQIVEGDVAMKLRDYLPTGRVAHLQMAGTPGRHEPDVGELHYPYLFEVIDEVSAQCGWQGWVGCEYRPRRGAEPGGTSAGLGWMARWR